MWRDQPVWNYALHHFGVVPLVFSNKKGSRVHGTHSFYVNRKNMGFKKHSYTEATDTKEIV